MIKKFLEFAIDRPVLNHIFMVLMVIMSIFAYQNIAKEIFPASTLDKISISGSYMGASADVLDKMAVKTLEDNLKSISEIDTVYSTIQNGVFNIVADVKTGNDTQLVLTDAKDVVANIKRDLPSDMDEPVVKLIKHEYPLLLVAVSGNVEIKRLIEVADDLKSKLSLISNLNSIDIRGESDEEILITLDQKRIEGYGLSKEAVYKAISSISSIFPVGTVKEQGNHIYISTINGEKNKRSLEQTLLSVNGKRFYLSDIADVSFDLADPAQISHFDGKTNISLNITKNEQGNAIALAKEIRTVLKEFNNKYHDEVTFEAYADSSIWIKNRLNLVSSNILFGLLLVTLALFLSLNFRIALVVGIGIPASFMITLIFADVIGYSLNMLTLLGALIALGMLVDEAIVVAENIYRHVEMGKSPREAAIDGASEMFPAILTATMTTVFAFLPLLIMTGKMGMFMKVLPVMISILLISSLFEAFYFLPLHAKEFFSIGNLAKNQHQQEGKSGIWKRIDQLYNRILSLLLKFKKLSLFIMVVAILLGTAAIGKITKFQMFPEFDVQQVFINGKVNINNELKDTEKYVSIIEKELLLKLDMNETTDSFTTVIGFRMNADMSSDIGDNLFQIIINLHEKAPENFFDRLINPIFSLEYDDADMIRKIKAHELLTEIEKNILSDIREYKENGEKVFEEFNIFAQQTGIVGNDIEIGFSSLDSPKVLEAIKKVEENLSKVSGVHDIGDNADEGERELKLRVNEYGQSLGLSEGFITSALRGSFFKGEYAKAFNQEGLVRIKVEDRYKDQKGSIENFKITTAEGQVVVISDVCDFYYQKSFVKIFKEDGEKVRSLFARVDKKVIVPTDVMTQLQPLLEEIEKDGVKIIIKGEQKENIKLKKEMQKAAILAVFLIFITLIWMFNSLVLPLIILSIVPLSVFGVLLGTKLMGINMTMPGIMGLIGLAGVVVNDGLIMLEFVRKAKTQNEILYYASMRVRPIILTSVTTVLGLLSLIFFASGQALILQPMAISLGFGIAWATVLNLYFVPLMYAVIYGVERDR